MDELAAKRRMQKLKLACMLGGFFVAVFFWAYTVVEAKSTKPISPAVDLAGVILCPPLLLQVLFFDIDPRSLDFAGLWFVISVLNGALYAGVGWLVSLWWCGPQKVRPNWTER